jgi:hypothetical protein
MLELDETLDDWAIPNPDTRPVLLLDIDGVLNVAPNVGGWDIPPVRVKAGFPVYYEPRLIDAIRDLHARGVAEIRWATTWCGYPELGILERVLGLKFERAFGDRPMPKTWGDLKVEAALAVLEEGRRLIWVDDSEVDAGRRLYPKIAAAQAEGRALLVEPDSARGMQPGHLAAIEEFACRPQRSTV